MYASTSGLVNWLGFKLVAQKMINERDLFLPIAERIIAKLKQTQMAFGNQWKPAVL